MPVLALIRRVGLARQLAPWWGITPVVADFPSGTEDALRVMEDTLLARGTVERGESVVVVGSTPFAQRGRTNFVKAHRVIGRA
jgi:pyruvate kinase